MTKQITLNLTPEEAGVLNLILSRIGGIPAKTKRGYAEAIHRKLDNAMRNAGLRLSAFWNSDDWSAQDACFDHRYNRIYFTEQSMNVVDIEEIK